MLVVVGAAQVGFRLTNFSPGSSPWSRYLSVWRGGIDLCCGWPWIVDWEIGRFMAMVARIQ